MNDSPDSAPQALDDARLPRLLIVHPEGNVFNNPNLHALIEVLASHYEIDVLVPWRRFNQGVAFASTNVRMIECPPLLCDARFAVDGGALTHLQAGYLRDGYRMVLGIDRDGIVLGRLLASRAGIPYALLSYEIFFAAETSPEFKRVEIEACRDLAFVIVQDTPRAQHLSAENQLASTLTTLLMPVAPRRSRPYRHDDGLRRALGIAPDKRVLLFMGSVASWTGIDDVLRQVHTLPEPWVLLVHDRYGDATRKVRALAPDALGQRVYCSDTPLATNADMHRLIHCADLGLALYKPDLRSAWVGRNIAYIGMASGKINVYLQHGLPVVISPNEIMTPLLDAHEAGYSVDSIEALRDVLERHVPSDAQRARCLTLFETRLSLDVHIAPVLDAIAQCVGRTPHPSSTPWSETEVFVTLRQALRRAGQMAPWTFDGLMQQVARLRASNERFVVFGTGVLGQTLMQWLPGQAFAFVDDSSDRVTHDIVEGETYAPQNLRHMTFDRVLIGVTGHSDALVKRLTNELGMSESQIVTFR